jgi:hypothetical protein
MQKSHESESATHIGPQSCGAARKSGFEALTGGSAGRVFSRIRSYLRDAVVGRHIRYYAVPMNHNALWIFRFHVGWLWHRALSRRGQNGRPLWHRMRRFITRWLTPPSVCHPYPLRRMGVII